MPAPLNANELCLSTPTCLLPLRKTMPLTLAVACAIVMVDVYICIAMARGDTFVQPYQFDPESDQEGEAEEVQTLWLQQDISEWLIAPFTLAFEHGFSTLIPRHRLSENLSKVARGEILLWRKYQGRMCVMKINHHDGQPSGPRLQTTFPKKTASVLSVTESD